MPEKKTETGDTENTDRPVVEMEGDDQPTTTSDFSEMTFVNPGVRLVKNNEPMHDDNMSNPGITHTRAMSPYRNLKNPGQKST